MFSYTFTELSTLPISVVLYMHGEPFLAQAILPRTECSTSWCSVFTVNIMVQFPLDCLTSVVEFTVPTDVRRVLSTTRKFWKLKQRPRFANVPRVGTYLTCSCTSCWVQRELQGEDTTPTKGINAGGEEGDE